MQRFFSLALMLSAIAVLTSCEVVESGGYGRDYSPTVSLPEDLNNTERRLLGAVVDVLEDAGYQITRGSSAEYELEFEIDDGPVNADVYITLLRDGDTLVKSYARTGGPRIIIDRDGVIRDSFEKSLSDFERRLPSPGGRRGSYDDYRSGSPGDRYREDDYRGSDRRRSGYNEEYDRDPRYYR